jgi:hypothetical protein
MRERTTAPEGLSVTVSNIIRSFVLEDPCIPHEMHCAAADEAAEEILRVIQKCGG